MKYEVIQGTVVAMTFEGGGSAIICVCTTKEVAVKIAELLTTEALASRLAFL